MVDAVQRPAKHNNFLEPEAKPLAEMTPLERLKHSQH